MTPAEDPWLWTTDELIARVCRSITLFQGKSCSVDRGPDVEALEQHLRKNNITGAIFLTASDSHALKDQSYFPHLGQLNALGSVIDYLRQSSPAYKQHITGSGTESTKSNMTVPSHAADGSDHFASDCQTGAERRKIADIAAAPLSVLPSDHVVTTLDPTVRPAIEFPSLLESQWDHLLRWQQLDTGREVSLAELDEIDDKEQYRLEYSSEEDLQDEQDGHEVDEEYGNPQDSKQGRTNLDRDQIVDIINERIEYYTNSWTPNKGVLKADEVDYNVQTMWEEAEAAGQRQQLITKHNTDLAYYRQRLDQLCDEILKFPGSNLEKLRHQCCNLEVTINSMELAEWLLSIYSLEPMSESDLEADNMNLSSQRDQSKSLSSLSHHRAEMFADIVDLESHSKTYAEVMDDDADLENYIEPASSEHQTPLGPTNQGHEQHSITTSGIESSSKAFVSTSPVGGAPLLSPRNAFSDEPENASIIYVKRWRWMDLIERRDRKRIVSKIVYNMNTEDRELIRARLISVGRASMAKEIPVCIEMLSKGERRMPGVLSRDLPKIVVSTRLFLSWWFCDNYFQQEPPWWHLEELRQSLEANASDPKTFYDYLDKIMSTTFNQDALRHPERPSQAEVIEISDDEEEESVGGLAARRSQIGGEPAGSQQNSAIFLN